MHSQKDIDHVNNDTIEGTFIEDTVAQADENPVTDIPRSEVICDIKTFNAHCTNCISTKECHLATAPLVLSDRTLEVAFKGLTSKGGRDRKQRNAHHAQYKSEYHGNSFFSTSCTYK